MTGIVLAAGESRRMGKHKALLDVDGETFLRRAVRVLRDGGCEQVIAVVREEPASLASEARSAGARVVVNRIRGAEQVDSLRLALEAAPPGATAAVVLPVDHPTVSASVVRALLHAHRDGKAPIVRPSYDGVAGHPTLFARSTFADLIGRNLPDGARTIIHERASEVHDVAVSEPGVVLDVNLPEEYRRVVEGE